MLPVRLLHHRYMSEYGIGNDDKYLKFLIHSASYAINGYY